MIRQNYQKQGPVTRDPYGGRADRIQPAASSGSRASSSTDTVILQPTSKSPPQTKEPEPSTWPEFCSTEHCYNAGVTNCKECGKLFCDSRECYEKEASYCVGCFSAKRRRTSSSVGAAAPQKPPVKIEVKEQIDTDDVTDPLAVDTYASDQAKLEELEAQYEAYIAGRRKKLPTAEKVRIIGARLSKFAKSAARSRTASVPSHPHGLGRS